MDLGRISTHWATNVFSSQFLDTPDQNSLILADLNPGDLKNVREVRHAVKKRDEKRTKLKTTTTTTSTVLPHAWWRPMLNTPVILVRHDMKLYLNLTQYDTDLCVLQRVTARWTKTVCVNRWANDSQSVSWHVPANNRVTSCQSLSVRKALSHSPWSRCHEHSSSVRYLPRTPVTTADTQYYFLSAKARQNSADCFRPSHCPPVNFFLQNQTKPQNSVAKQEAAEWL